MSETPTKSQNQSKPRKKFRFAERSVLPGFNLTFGLTVTYLGLLIVIPLCGMFLTVTGVTPERFVQIITNYRVIAAFKLTFGASFLAALINAFFGFVVAWVLVRYRFWGRRLVDAMVDLPFALPTAVSGLALAYVYSPQGWIGRFLPFAVNGTQLGVLVALTFIGLPFVVRTMQPALQDIEGELEEAAASLGASRWQTFWRIIFPTVFPALLAGFTMAFARALGEYGSVIFISGSKRSQTEIVSKLIAEKLNEEDGIRMAAVLAATMLVTSFAMLFLINLAQYWQKKR